MGLIVKSLVPSVLKKKGYCLMASIIAFLKLIYMYLVVYAYAHMAD